LVTSVVVGGCVRLSLPSMSARLHLSRSPSPSPSPSRLVALALAAPKSPAPSMINGGTSTCGRHRQPGVSTFLGCGPPSSSTIVPYQAFHQVSRQVSLQLPLIATWYRLFSPSPPLLNPYSKLLSLVSLALQFSLDAYSNFPQLQQITPLIIPKNPHQFYTTALLPPHSTTHQDCPTPRYYRNTCVKLASKPKDRGQ